MHRATQTSINIMSYLLKREEIYRFCVGDFLIIYVYLRHLFTSEVHAHNFATFPFDCFRSLIIYSRYGLSYAQRSVYMYLKYICIHRLVNILYGTLFIVWYAIIIVSINFVWYLSNGVCVYFVRFLTNSDAKNLTFLTFAQADNKRENISSSHPCKKNRMMKLVYWVKWKCAVVGSGPYTRRTIVVYT